MEPHLQRVEVEAVRRRDDDLAVNHRARRQLLDQGLVQLREIAVERLQVAALDEHVGRVAEHDGAKAIPLRLVQKVLAARQGLGELREHRLDRRRDGERLGPGRHRSVSTTFPILRRSWI